MERGLPFISSHNVDEVVGMPDVNLSVNLAMARRVEEVGDKWKGIAVFLRELVKASIVNENHPSCRQRGPEQCEQKRRAE